MSRQTLVSRRSGGIIVLSFATFLTAHFAKAQATWTTSGTNTYICRGEKAKSSFC
jgi:hypothetical protein